MEILGTCWKHCNVLSSVKTDVVNKISSFICSHWILQKNTFNNHQKYWIYLIQINLLIISSLSQLIWDLMKLAIINMRNKFREKVGNIKLIFVCLKRKLSETYAEMISWSGKKKPRTWFRNNNLLHKNKSYNCNTSHNKISDVRKQGMKLEEHTSENSKQSQQEPKSTHSASKNWAHVTKKIKKKTEQVLISILKVKC